MSEVNEDPASRARRYIEITERAIQNQKFKEEDHQVRSVDVKKIVDTIHRYINDARYYLEHGRATTALASVAYAEGLLDALKFLELSESPT
ncbi:MAG TPA: DUF357 domain-containing protein [Candidatus Acidoferrum sp.]|nr:DUF357 domain-containing protein [Candidatus Acidoferrum sp.]